MDSVIDKPERGKLKLFMIVSIILIILVLYIYYVKQEISIVSVNDIEVITIKSLSPEIRTVGTIKPIKSIKLSSDIGGRVKYYLNRKQSFVEEGEVLLELENYDYILKLTEKIAQISEQISNLKNTRLNIRRELTSSKLLLADATYYAESLQREFKQKHKLFEKKLTQEADLKDVKDNLLRWRIKQEEQKKYTQSQSNQISDQLEDLDKTVEILNSLLLKLQESTQQLVIRSPISGNLVGFDVESGQQISPKEEFASIDVINDYLIEVELSEYYLDRINNDMHAVAKLENNRVNLDIIKIFPFVKHGKFKMHFKTPKNSDWRTKIKVGQSVEIQLKDEQESAFSSVPIRAVFYENNKAYIYIYNQSIAVKTIITVKDNLGDKLLVQHPQLSGKNIIVLDWNKKYKEELRIE
ncbi:HlyD family efflux transporter periplasmic adaptor subunit [Pseudoalteromonas sp. B62]|uniref:HlyD family efflux transporter periplasmic adaptor subunit n=1 Tax=Pseudoalteromonas sp. B62 TaxID=630483 RepID=UPI00301D8E18